MPTSKDLEESLLAKAARLAGGHSGSLAIGATISKARAQEHAQLVRREHIAAAPGTSVVFESASGNRPETIVFWRVETFQFQGDIDVFSVVTPVGLAGDLADAQTIRFENGVTESLTEAQVRASTRRTRYVK